jgi:hypothetical protein
MNILELQLLAATSGIPDGRHASFGASDIPSATRRVTPERRKVDVRR